MTQRKTDHITLAALSAPAMAQADQRFNYEPLLGIHPGKSTPVFFLGKTMEHPLWISSMTGGSAESGPINHLLAEACAEFGLGMGLGSCRPLLENNDSFDDFNLRPVLGPDRPFFANIGIAQVEKLLEKGEFSRIDDLVGLLDADGLIIHVNPVQEWLQTEGDRFRIPAMESLTAFIDHLKKRYLLIVKEVGQGIGPESLKALFRLNIDALELGAFGGTNFANIEIMRNTENRVHHLHPLATVGHNLAEMLDTINALASEKSMPCRSLILSGGIRNFLDGYYYMQQSIMPSVYGMANVLLQHALISKNDLFDFIRADIEGYRFASRFLTLRK
ncbi:MAG TPA: isopentenyl-diphosphate delta-isomerase [Prolixibacteraceae bacterium]|nr:isopentenyl-diphosphate delta-isomerase [Prolixibacteraceae bacterium]